jgi:hypothetical protein
MPNDLKMIVSVEESSHPFADEWVISVSKVLEAVIKYLLYYFFWATEFYVPTFLRHWKFTQNKENGVQNTAKV